MIDIQDINASPDLAEIGGTIRNPLFETLCRTMEEEYRAKCLIEFSKCTMASGWNVKYKKSGKGLCTIYPKENYFTVLVVVGAKEKPAVEEMLLSASAAMREIYEQTEEGNGQRWLMVDLEDDDEVYRDVMKIIDIRAKTKR